MAKKLKQKANSAWEISVEDAGNVWDALKNPLHNTLDMAGIIPGADIPSSFVTKIKGFFDIFDFV